MLEMDQELSPLRKTRLLPLEALCARNAQPEADGTAVNARERLFPHSVIRRTPSVTTLLHSWRDNVDAHWRKGKSCTQERSPRPVRWGACSPSPRPSAPHPRWPPPMWWRPASNSSAQGFAGDAYVSINVEDGFLVVRNFNDAIFAGSVTCTNVDASHGPVRQARASPRCWCAPTRGADTVRNNTALPARPLRAGRRPLLRRLGPRPRLRRRRQRPLDGRQRGQRRPDGRRRAADSTRSSAVRATTCAPAEKETTCEGDAHLYQRTYPSR